MESDVDGLNGWASENSTEAFALRHAFMRKSVTDVMGLLKQLNARQVAAVLAEIGFRVDESQIERGRAAVFSSVQADVSKALVLGVDGVGLARGLRGLNFSQIEVFGSGRNDWVLGFGSDEFSGDLEAATVIQGVFRADSVSVDLLGEEAACNRSSLRMVAAQALRCELQGFSFEGVPGKYAIDLPLREVLDVHREAVAAFAVECVRSALGAWAQGTKVPQIDTWVPDSVQRMLAGNASVDAAHALLVALDSGAIERHGREIGGHGFESLLSAQGVNANVKTVGEMAHESGLAVKPVDRQRGQYFGPVLAVDHRAALVKVTRHEAIELDFGELPSDRARPQAGDTLRIGFKAGVLSFTSAGRGVRESSGVAR